jgi:ribonuclease P protein component
VFKKATRSRDKWFTVLCRENDGNNVGARLGLAISKKNCRAAATRNRIKRIIRESFRHHQLMLTGLDVVVINQPAARDGSNRQLMNSLDSHWQRCEKMGAEQAAQKE